MFFELKLWPIIKVESESIIKLLIVFPIILKESIFSVDSLVNRRTLFIIKSLDKTFSPWFLNVMFSNWLKDDGIIWVPSFWKMTWLSISLNLKCPVIFWLSASMESIAEEWLKKLSTSSSFAMVKTPELWITGPFNLGIKISSFPNMKEGLAVNE